MEEKGFSDELCFHLLDDLVQQGLAGIAGHEEDLHFRPELQDPARQLGAVLPSDIDTLVQNVQCLADRMQPFQPTLCHNDLLPANVVDDGDRLWLIDWEYAGIGNPLFDLAGVAANFQLTDEESEDLLQCYLGGSSDTAAEDTKRLGAASLLREALWAVIQTRASTLEFDFSGYATKHLDAFRDRFTAWADQGS